MSFYFQLFAWPAVLLIALSGSVLLAGFNWRLQLGALSSGYLGVFILVGMSWPMDLAVIKLITGWMAATILGLTRIGGETDVEERERWPTERIFRLLIGGLVAMAVASLVPSILEWMPGLMPAQAWGSLILIGFGVLLFALSTQPFAMLISLLAFIAGFEILYASVESSTLVAGLLAVINLGLALVGFYLMPAVGTREGAS